MLETAPVKQELIISDQIEEAEEVNLDSSIDESKLRTIEKIKKIE